MSISEKTLELNITHELLSFADSLWMMIFRQSSYRSNVNYPSRMRRQIPVALGLSLQEEKGQGWDVKINFPSNNQMNRAVFIQYKKPHFLNYCTKSDSVFYGTKRNRTPHYLFGINNNTPKDQHIKLRALAGNNHISNSVLYALPRILNQNELQQWSGGLTNFTSFMTIKELDDVASNSGVSILTGDKHEIRMLSSGELKEMHSEPNVLDIKDDSSKGFLSDTITWRMHKSLYAHTESLDKEVEIKEVVKLENFKNIYLDLALYFPVSPTAFPDLFDETESRTIQKNQDEFINEYKKSYGSKDLEKMLYTIEGRFFESLQKIRRYESHLSELRYFGEISIQYESKYLASFRENNGNSFLNLKSDEGVSLSNLPYSIF